MTAKQKQDILVYMTTVLCIFMYVFMGINLKYKNVSSPQAKFYILQLFFFMMNQY